jgi:hypothetical protein
MPGATEARELSEMEESRGSPPLELRRTTSMPLQSPGDRITGKYRQFLWKNSLLNLLFFADSPMMAPLYLSPRIPQPYFYEGETIKSMPTAEPPPAHRAPSTVYTPQSSTLPPPTNHTQIQREATPSVLSVSQQPPPQKEGYQYVYSAAQNPPPQAQGLVAPSTNPRPIQLATPPIASQVPPQADTLPRLLEVYPLMWQGLLALKTEQAAVQMHFVFGNKKIAKASLPVNADHTTPPLRIAQRMRMEPSQIEGVARKMQVCKNYLK